MSTRYSWHDKLVNYLKSFNFYLHNISLLTHQAKFGPQGFSLGLTIFNLCYWLWFFGCVRILICLLLLKHIAKRMLGF